MSELTPKRRRLETEDAEASVNGSLATTRSEGLWLDDGNIILQAEATQFRVHRSMLARHSVVFKDMFSMPQPDEDPVFEGCPVITLSDKAEDLKQILSVFYDNFGSMDLSKDIPISRASIMLRLGKKYDISLLRDEALKRLRQDFPVTLMEWDNSYEGHCGPSLDFSFVSPSQAVADVIALGLEEDVSTILPGVFFYYIVKTSLEDIVLGESSLPHDVRMKCIVGRDRLFIHLRGIVNNWAGLEAFMDLEYCTRGGLCVQKKTQLLRELEHVFWGDNGMPFSLASISDLPFPAGQMVKDLCKFCAASVEGCYEEARESIWDALPGFFSLPRWHELKDFDT
ncbi:unnamed protein product [Cyclocybe aegerita]|uniref:BTB domain-containing protein n=1 Tax=Cyclocybe aegerita TaxID=1973307 RepID=A0A8S0XM93_CYCAE|nr:unnamed protein product [Cyclocybe aegerita]